MSDTPSFVSAAGTSRFGLLSPPDWIAGFYRHLGDYPTLLGLLAERVSADAVRLGLDLGSGYRHDHVDRCALAAALITDTAGRRQHLGPERFSRWALDVGTAGRRAQPRSRIELVRSPGRPAFTSQDRKQIAQLLPHLNQALALSQEIEACRAREMRALAALDCSTTGVILLGRDGRVFRANQTAHALLAQIGIDIGASITGCRTLQPCLDPRATAQREMPFDFILHGEPLILARIESCAGERDTFLLRLCGHSGQDPVLPHVLSVHFGLTPGEFRLASAMAEGWTLKQCAQRWGRSYDTLRDQLKSLLAKTGTHRQTALAILLNRYRMR